MSVRNLFRDAIFDWLKETFQDGYIITIRSRAVAYVKRDNASVLVRVMADAVRVGGHTYMSDDPKFFNNIKDTILLELAKYPNTISATVVNGEIL